MSATRSIKIEPTTGAMGFIRRHDKILKAPLSVFQEFYRSKADVDACNPNESFGVYRYVQVGGASTNQNGILGWVKYVTSHHTISSIVEQHQLKNQKTTSSTENAAPAQLVDGCVDVEATPLPPIRYHIHKTGVWHLCCTPELHSTLTVSRERELVKQYLLEYERAAAFEEQSRMQEMKEKSDRVIEESTEVRSDQNVNVYTVARVRAANARIKIQQCDDASELCRSVIKHELDIMHHIHSIFPEMAHIYMWNQLGKHDPSVKVDDKGESAKILYQNWRRRKSHRMTQVYPSSAQYDTNKKLDNTNRVIFQENDGKDNPLTYIHVPEFNEKGFT